MRNRRLALLCIALICALAFPTLAQEGETVTDVLAGDPERRFTTFLAALGAADLIGPLLELEDFTLFAPTDEAFAAALDILAVTEEDLLADPELLETILLYHVVPSERLLVSELMIYDELETLAGEALHIAFDDRILVNGVPLSDADSVFAFGVMHTIDRVLIPPSLQALLAERAVDVPASVIDLLAADPEARYTTLVAMFEAAQLAETLSVEGPFTILAPTDDAIAESLDALDTTLQELLADTETLTAILQYHVIPGEPVVLDSLAAQESLDTLLGERLEVESDGENVSLDGARVIAEGARARNGIVLGVDGLLIPPSLRDALAVTEAAPQETAFIRFANFSPDTASVDAYFNGELSEIAALDSMALSEWVVVPAGTHTVHLAPADTSIAGEIFGPADFTFAPDTWTTVALVGSSEDGTLLAQPVLEDLSPIQEGNTRITVFHALEKAPPVDVIFGGNTAVSRLGYPGSVGSNDGAFVIEVPARAYDIQFVTTGAAEERILAALEDAELEPGNYYFLALTGSTARAGAVLEATEAGDLAALRE